MDTKHIPEDIFSSSSYGVNNEVVQIKCVGEFMNESLRNNINANVFCTDNFHLPDSYNNQPTISSEGNHFDYALAGQHINHSNLASNYTTNDWNSGISTSGVACGTAKTVNEADVFSYFENAFQSKNHTKKNDGESNYTDIKREPKTLKYGSTKISHNSKGENNIANLLSSRIVSTSKNTERPSNKISDEKKVLIENISSLDPEEELAKEKNIWTRSAPSDLYYSVQSNHVVHATKHLSILCNEFKECLLDKPEQIRANLPKYGPLMRKKRVSIKKKDCHSCSNAGKCSSSSSSSGSEDSSDDDCEYKTQELEHKKNHPLRLHPELWFNDHGQMNDGPLCRCSVRAQRSGIRHNIYAGEKNTTLCEPNSNNADKLYHYRITISPPTNFLVKTPTVIEHDSHEYIFEGFSMFSHKKLGDLPLCKVIRFNIEYTIVYYEEKFPQNFTIQELDYFNKYLFQELLELVDLDLKAHGDPGGCPQYHFLPRFVRQLPENGKEILCMNEVLRYLMKSYTELISPADQASIPHMQQDQWQVFTEAIKGMIVTYPGKKPCSLRVDQLDRDHLADEGNSSEPSTTPQAHTSFSTPLDSSQEPRYPKIVHFGIRPPQLSYAGNPEYQKSWREYVKFRHLIANMPKPSHEDKRKLRVKEIKLQKMRIKNELKRNVTVTVCGKHFMKTGIMCDIVQHAMLIPVLVSHLRFHRSIDKLEEKLDYQFQNRFLIQLALTHPSYRENFGTNPDHARNSLTNCGIRQPVYGDRRIHYMNTRKRGINTLINIMSRFGKTEETESNITHNERLEFLGDAVVEFSTSVHLFHMFPELEEGGLATYRAAIVQNQHLALLAKTLGLEQYMLYAHGSDLCHDLELRHAMANCFEALMGALFLDGGIRVADKVFGEALFQDVDLLDQWVNFPPHPLQEQEPLGDRKWIEHFPMLQKLTKFEVQMGIEFTHIRLLARAFTDRSVGFINLTLGSNQRLEFLGDTVLQLIASDYLYRYFPEHHEGHLSLLRSSLVNNRTQAVVCDDLGMTEYALYSNPKGELKTKDRADLLEAFLGALYIDKGMEHCITFCDVCFFPRLQNFIMHQDWNDPKSKLQQCCLTLRTMEGGEPEIPFYKVIECMGPTNTRIYTVAVYFKGQRLAKASGHSIQQAEMNAAKKALSNSKDLFPQLDHQKRVISKSMHRQNNGNNRSYSLSNRKAEEDDNNCIVKKNNLPLAYQRRNRSKSPEQNSSIKTQSDRTDSRQTTSVITKTNSEISSSSAEKFTFASKTKQITDKAVKQIKNERDKGQGGGDEKCRDFTNNKVNTRLTSKTNPISSISKNTDLARMKTRRQTSCNALKPREMDKRVFSSTRSDCNLNSGQIMPTTKYLTRNQSKRTPEKRLSGDNIYIEDSSPSEWNVGNQPSSQTRSRSRNLTRGMLRDNERHVPFAKRTKRSRSTERIHPLDFLLSRKNHSSDHMTDTPGLLMDLMFSKNKNTPPQSTSHQSDAFNGSTYGDNHSSQPYDSYLNLISPSFSKSQSGHYENTNAVSNVLAICPVMKMFPHSGSS